MNWPDCINTVVHGDALSVLRQMPDGVIQTCITSPPYWGLRDYGVDNQLGLEKTPEEYVAKLVKVFREVRRVLRDDGTLWLNLGDSYSQGCMTGTVGPNSMLKAQTQQNYGTIEARKAKDIGLKPKDLVGVPWMVAFALRSEGWYLRSEIIWFKKNPMPESVTDRPTKAHEQLFLLAKNQKYYYNADAIREPHTHKDAALNTGNWAESVKDKGYANALPEARAAGRSVAMSRPKDYIGNVNGRNKRSVWEIATEPTPYAHFATFPIKLIEPCILAGSKEGSIVLDPFMGSGTVGLRSKELSRQYFGVELNEEYIKIANQRLAQNELFGPKITVDKY